LGRPIATLTERTFSLISGSAPTISSIRIGVSTAHSTTTRSNDYPICQRGATNADVRCSTSSTSAVCTIVGGSTATTSIVSCGRTSAHSAYPYFDYFSFNHIQDSRHRCAISAIAPPALGSFENDFDLGDTARYGIGFYLTCESKFDWRLGKCSLAAEKTQSNQKRIDLDRQHSERFA
jgi:hypothetical protein